MSQTYQVIVWSTGQVGKQAIQAVVSHPQLELVGLWVHSEEKEGKDAGELAGIEPLGVSATRDAKALLEMDADVVVYTSLEVGRDDVVDEVATILASGKNLISTAAGLASEYEIGPEAAQKIREACEAGNSTLYACGLTPDGAESVLLSALGITRGVECVSRTEICDLTNYMQPWIFPYVGFGPPDTKQDGVMAQGFYRPVAHLLADAIGVKLDDFKFSGKAYPASKEFNIRGHQVNVGDAAVTYHRLEGYAEGVMRVVVDGYYRIGALEHDQYPKDDPEWPVFLEPAGYRLTATGEPDMMIEWTIGERHMDSMDICIAATAQRAVNRIPGLVEAPSGVITMMDLTPVANPRKAGTLLGETVNG